MASREHSIDTSVPHPARRYNYWLGGKDHFAADRESGDAIAAAFPVVVELARANRAFLRRAVRFVAGAGVRQFLDIGTGLPAPDNTHEVAQGVTPSARIVYVDNDPLVLVHARALLTSDPAGTTDYIDADVRDTGRVLAGAARTLDLHRPVAIMMLGVLNFLLDDDEVHRVVSALVGAVPSGSYLVVTHPTVELGGEMNVPAMQFYNKRAEPKIRTRSGAEVAALFDGLDLIEPGLVSASRWRHPAGPAPAEMPLWAAVGRKP